MSDLKPQAKQMADESMVRNLAAQARAIWPQEVALFDRYDLPQEPYILDAGCGTGEASSRLVRLYPDARIVGVNIIDAHLDLARRRYAKLASGLTFEHQSIYGLTFADDTFDLVTCRHVIHSIPHADQVIAELVRVAKPGGYLHLIPEDYGMLHFQSGMLDIRRFGAKRRQASAKRQTPISSSSATPMRSWRSSSCATFGSTMSSSIPYGCRARRSPKSSRRGMTAMRIPSVS
jgi:ubiquinone/menaquinone biosynthesis C-methylase UbiE